MIIITGKAKVSDENRAAFQAVAERQVTNSRLEAGCVSYAYYEDAMDRGTFFFFEEWADQSAVDFHFARPYCLEFIAKARELASSPPEIKIQHVLSA